MSDRKNTKTSWEDLAELKKAKDPIQNWDELMKFYYGKEEETGFPKNKRRLFRGEKLKEWNRCNDNVSLKSSLDLAFEKYEPRENKKSEIEQKITREFERKAHIFIQDKAENWLETLALLRHYEGPARILDWTYSFFRAVFSATCESNDGGIVWAIDLEWLHKKDEEFETNFIKSLYWKSKKRRLRLLRYEQQNDFQNEIIKHLIKKNPKGIIYAACPYYLNEKLSIQQGALLFQGTVENIWSENLLDMLNKEKEENITNKKLWKIKIFWDCNKKERNRIIEELHNMNINEATLFPDLGGFARSLRTRIAHPKSLGITD